MTPPNDFSLNCISLKSPDDILAFLRRHPKLIFADDFEIAVQYENSQKRGYIDGKSTQRESFEGFWVGIRVLHRKRPGEAVTTDVTPNGLRAVVDRALHSADLSSMDPWFRFPMWKPLPASGVAVENGQYDSLASYLSHMPIGFTESYGTRAVQTVLARKNEKYELRGFQNAHDAFLTILSSGGEEPARMQERWSHPTQVSDRGKRLERMSTQAALHATLDKRKSLLTDARDLVLAPNVAADWVASLATSLSSTEVARARTFWDSIAGPVSAALTLVDDGKLDDIPYASSFDIEGSPTQRTVILESGERKSFLHDAYSSARANRVSTGNRMRPDGDSHPAILPWHLSVAAGEAAQPWNQSTLVAYIDEAVAGPTGGSNRSQKGGGRWDRVLAGLLLRRGEPVARIRPFKVSWSHAEMLQGISAIDNSSQMFGNVSTPSIWWEKMPK